MSLHHCHILFHEDKGMMAPFMINAQASAAICKSSYDKGVHGCGINYPVAFQPEAHADCLRKVARADHLCRKRIPPSIRGQRAPGAVRQTLSRVAMDARTC